MLKVDRTKDVQYRKEWSKKHGHDTYGDDEDSDTAELKPKEAKRDKNLMGSVSVGLQHTYRPPISSAPTIKGD